MPKVTISASAFSVQQAKPNSRYRSINPIPLTNRDDNQMLLRTGLSRIPRQATVVSARLRIAQHQATTGSNTLEVRRISSSWDSNVTWNKKPDYAGGAVALTQAAGSASRRWVFDITTWVQAIVNGTASNRGWRLTTAETWTIKMRGAPANSRPPDLVVDYAVVPATPTNLHPSSGGVSTSHPWLTFDADEEITALQVQIDPLAAEEEPGWDSGTVAATGGLVELDDPTLATPYPGLDEGETTYWRVRQRNAAGWSGWSEWAEMSRVGGGVLTITQPPETTIGDETPTVAWAFTGTQTAWRVRIFDEDGDQLAGSGTNVGTDTMWAPRRGFTRSGQSGIIQVDVWDDTDRVATPDAPDYITATMPVTFVYDPAIDPVEELQATQVDQTPDVQITGLRPAIPDRVALYRSVGGAPFELVDRFDAMDVFTSGTGNLLVNTNRLTNPAVTGGINGWEAGQDTTVGYSTAETWVGTGSVLATMTGTDGDMVVNTPLDQAFSVTPSEIRPVSVRVKPESATARRGRVGLWSLSESGSLLGAVYGDWIDLTPTQASDFTEVTAQIAVPDTAARAGLSVQIEAGYGERFYLDGGMVASMETDPANPDAGQTVPSYFDGNSVQEGFRFDWTGLEDASTSEKRTDGTAASFTLVDRDAPMQCPNVRYYVAAGVGDRYSEDNPIARLATGGLGVWITDLDTGERAVIWGVEAEQEATEQAIEHQPLNRATGPYNQRMIRRRLVTYQRQGTITGILADVSQPGMPTARQCELMFRAWRNNDAGHRYQLHLGRFSSPVILGNIALSEREENRALDRVLNVSLSWWGAVGPEDY